MATGESSEALFEKYRGWLRLYARSLQLHPALGRRLDASDLVQEACVRVLSSREPIRGQSEGELRNYLKAVLRNVALDHARKHFGPEADLMREQHFDRIWDESACVAEKWLEGRDPSPSAGPRREEATAALLAAIDGLPEPHREILLLLKFEGLTTREAAERLGSSKTAVALKAAEAMRRLREVLGPSFGEGDDG